MRIAGAWRDCPERPLGHGMTELPHYRDSGRGPFLQTALDIINVVFGLLFVLALASSVPLAIALMMFATF